TVYGFVTVYNGTVQIYPINVEDAVVPVEKVETPSILCSNNIVSITCATADAQVFYTTNGDEPDATAELYDGAFSITETVTVKAIALKEGYDNSDVAEKVCEYVGQGGDTPAIDSPAEFDFTPASETVSAYANKEIASSKSQTKGDSNDLSGVNITKQNVTLAFTSGSTNSRWWTDGARLYNGGSLTVSVPQGLQIDKITFTQAATDWNATVSTGTYNKSTKEWTPAAAEAAYADEAPAAKPVASVTFSSTGKTFFSKVKVDYSQDLTGVDSIVAGDDENATVEYYNLQGVRVQNPANGLYIVKKGNKVSKQLIR
ncbi:MAG: chitobiase/beta-hexosaminidase C-terminal domain-containing protein, partial [Bacteroidales bacterium]|nr:chitobiase/beta-hexosaminidase C-terminal domain-containing protein [Bacteroidales bacterium]